MHKIVRIKMIKSILIEISFYRSDPRVEKNEKYQHFRRNEFLLQLTESNLIEIK